MSDHDKPAADAEDRAAPDMAIEPPPAETVPCSMGQFFGYFLRLGTFGFGGPIALAGYMQRDLVEQRRWISKQDYVEGLALAQLAPGPLAAQLAMYLGWVRGGILGATLVSVAFIVPSFVMVVVLAALYLEYGSIPWLQAAFYGIGAAVIAIIARSAVKLIKLTIAKDLLLWAIFVANAVVVAWTESEIIWVFLASGVITLFFKAPPRLGATATALSITPWSAWWVSGLHGPAEGETIGQIAWYFTKAGAFVFGSGLAIVPFLYGGVVEEYRWLNERQFLDAVAVAMITPGPVVITVGFIGYLVAGPVGAIAAALGTFLPCYFFTVIPAPYFRYYAKNPQINAFVKGVTAAATGAIGGAVIVLGRRAIIDFPTILIALVTLGVLFRAKVPEPLVILVAGLVGLLLKQSF